MNCKWSVNHCNSRVSFKLQCFIILVYRIFDSFTWSSGAYRWWRYCTFRVLKFLFIWLERAFVRCFQTRAAEFFLTAWFNSPDRTRTVSLLTCLKLLNHYLSPCKPWLENRTMMKPASVGVMEMWRVHISLKWLWLNHIINMMMNPNSSPENLHLSVRKVFRQVSQLLQSYIILLFLHFLYFL